MIKRLALPILLLASALFPACATAGQYQGITGTAMGLDSLAGSLRVMDASLPASMRTASYKDGRDKGVSTLKAAADMLPVGCEGSLSDGLTVAAQNARTAIMDLTSLIKGPAPTMAMRMKMASLDPSAIAGIVNGSIGAALQLVSGGFAIYMAVQSSQNQTVVQAKAACAAAVLQLQGDVKNLQAALAVADEATASQAPPPPAAMRARFAE